MLTPTLLWLGCAFVALAIELMTGTLYLLVVATALAGGALLSSLGASQALQLGSASIIGVLTWLLVNRWKRRQPPVATSAIGAQELGQPVRVLRIIGPGRARVFYRGAEWDAIFDGPAPETGSTATITGQDGNLLIISHHLSTNGTP